MGELRAPLVLLLALASCIACRAALESNWTQVLELPGWDDDEWWQENDPDCEESLDGSFAVTQGLSLTRKAHSLVCSLACAAQLQLKPACAPVVRLCKAEAYPYALHTTLLRHAQAYLNFWCFPTSDLARSCRTNSLHPERHTSR